MANAPLPRSFGEECSEALYRAKKEQRAPASQAALAALIDQTLEEWNRRQRSLPPFASRGKPATVWELREREKVIIAEVQKLEAEGRVYRGSGEIGPGEYPGFHMKEGYAQKIGRARAALREISLQLAGLHDED